MDPTPVRQRYGTFMRAIPLPDGASGDRAAANVKNGVLEILVPVTPARTPDVRKIDVKAG
jgi:HSP20 family protein